MVGKEALLRLSAFPEHDSDHDRIVACRRAFRRASRFIKFAKVPTLLLRDEAGEPAAVLGYIDQAATEDELREAIGGSVSTPSSYARTQPGIPSRGDYPLDARP